MTTERTSATAAIEEELRGAVGPGAVATSGPVYEETCRIWNGAVRHRPALVVRCRVAEEVSAAVVAAGRAGLPLSVRGAGHDWAGRALRDRGLVIDMSAMRG